MNFGKRTECFQCGLPKDGSGVPDLQLNNGNWYCTDCDVDNFSRRTTCFKCRRPKEEILDGKSYLRIHKD